MPRPDEHLQAAPHNQQGAIQILSWSKAQMQHKLSVVVVIAAFMLTPNQQPAKLTHRQWLAT
jgi:hypothetical protein